MIGRRPFVVLHHTGYGQPHFDLMIAIDDTGPLLTWRCPVWPIVDGSICVPLPPHRRIYLDYEGEVSGGRGAVRRVAAGDVYIETRNLTLTVIRFNDLFISLGNY